MLNIWNLILGVVYSHVLLATFFRPWPLGDMNVDNMEYAFIANVSSALRGTRLVSTFGGCFWNTSVSCAGLDCNSRGLFGYDKWTASSCSVFSIDLYRADLREVMVPGHAVRQPVCHPEEIWERVRQQFLDSVGSQEQMFRMARFEPTMFLSSLNRMATLPRYVPRALSGHSDLALWHMETQHYGDPSFAQFLGEDQALVISVLYACVVVCGWLFILKKGRYIGANESARARRLAPPTGVFHEFASSAMEAKRWEFVLQPYSALDYEQDELDRLLNDSTSNETIQNDELFDLSLGSGKSLCAISLIAPSDSGLDTPPPCSIDSTCVPLLYDGDDTKDSTKHATASDSSIDSLPQDDPPCEAHYTSQPEWPRNLDTATDIGLNDNILQEPQLSLQESVYHDKAKAALNVFDVELERETGVDARRLEAQDTLFATSVGDANPDSTSTGSDGFSVTVDTEISNGDEALTTVHDPDETEGMSTDFEQEDDEDQAGIDLDIIQSQASSDKTTPTRPRLVSSASRPAALPGIVPLDLPTSPPTQSVLLTSASCPGFLPSQSPALASDLEDYDPVEPRKIVGSQTCSNLALVGSQTSSPMDPNGEPGIPVSKSDLGISTLGTLLAQGAEVMLGAMDTVSQLVSDDTASPLAGPCVEQEGPLEAKEVNPKMEMACEEKGEIWDGRTSDTEQAVSNSWPTETTASSTKGPSKSPSALRSDIKMYTRLATKLEGLIEDIKAGRPIPGRDGTRSLEWFERKLKRAEESVKVAIEGLAWKEVKTVEKEAAEAAKKERRMKKKAEKMARKQAAKEAEKSVSP